MKLVWTKAGGSAVTLGEDAATPRKTILIEGFGGAGLVQKDALAFGTHPYGAALGNVSGQFAASVTQSCASQDAVPTLLATEYGRIGETGALEWHAAAKVFTFANAILETVQLAGLNGVRVSIRYTFFIRGVTLA